MENQNENPRETVESFLEGKWKNNDLDRMKTKGTLFPYS